MNDKVVLVGKYPKSGALVEIGKGGQVAPSKGNDVIAELTICLPMDEETNCLDSELQFQNRLVICCEALYRDWGDKYTRTCEITKEQKTWRYRERKFTGKTYKECFEQAIKYADEELGGLETLLAEREEALKKAEEGFNILSVMICK